MPVAFVSLPLTVSRFQHRKGLLPGHTYSVDSKLGGHWRDLADSVARLGLTDPSLKMQGQVVEEYQYTSVTVQLLNQFPLTDLITTHFLQTPIFCIVSRVDKRYLSTLDTSIDTPHTVWSAIDRTVEWARPRRKSIAST